MSQNNMIVRAAVISINNCGALIVLDDDHSYQLQLLTRKINNIYAAWTPLDPAVRWFPSNRAVDVSLYNSFKLYSSEWQNLNPNSTLFIWLRLILK